MIRESELLRWRGYDGCMCSYHEWERFRFRAQELIDEDQVRQLVSDAAARLEALAEELKAWAGSSDSDWGCSHGRRSRPEWVF